MDTINTFFTEFSIGNNKLYSSGKKNESIDGTGVLPSVDVKNSVSLINYIKKNYPHVNNILDVGAGQGYLNKAADDLKSSLGINCYSIEGCSDLIPHVKCDRNKYAIVDFSTKFEDERLKKKFDLTTSFEVLEHVHRKHQDIFWENLSYVSNEHLCSIHVANQQDHQHCCIAPLGKWLEYLCPKGKITILGKHPKTSDDENCNFRRETGLYNWDCSIMLHIKFN
jgi:hypothetical protein